MLEFVIGRGLNIVFIAILARLLTPEDFGTFALLAIFVGVAQALVESGFGQALIHFQDTTDEDNSTVFWISLGIGDVVCPGPLFHCTLYCYLFRDRRSCPTYAHHGDHALDWRLRDRSTRPARQATRISADHDHQSVGTPIRQFDGAHSGEPEFRGLHTGLAGSFLSNTHVRLVVAGERLAPHVPVQGPLGKTIVWLRGLHAGFDPPRGGVFKIVYLPHR